MAQRSRIRDDAGFTLVEVLVALLVLGIVATGALYFFINGTRTSTHLLRTQNAVAVANAAMEESYGIDPKDNVVTGTPGLAVGREQADVELAFSDMTALGIEGVNDTYPVWDASAANSSSAVLPISKKQNYGGQEYEVTTLVGACYRDSSVTSTDQDCVKLPGYATEPSTAPAGKVRMLRIVVAVTWEPLADECDGGLCSYVLNALVDRSDDLKWNQVVNPVAVDDTAVFNVGDPAGTLDVLANDRVGALNSYPVSLLNNPSVGSVSSPTVSGLFDYTPPPAGTRVSGIYTFDYRVRDAGGRTADAEVTIIISPKSADDSFTVLAGTSEIDILGNDIGSPVSVQITGGPALGSVNTSGTTVTYNSSESGIDSFTYTYTDGSGQVSPPATVRLVVEAVSIQDVTVQGAFRPTTSSPCTDVTAELMAANSTTTGIEAVVTGMPTAGTVKVDGTTYAGGTVSGSTVEVCPAAGSMSEWSFPFALKRGSYVTATRTATVQVAGLVAVDDVIGGWLNDNSTRNYLDVPGNDTPSSWPSSSDISVDLGTISSGCGSWAWRQDRLDEGKLRIALPNAPHSGTTGCTAQYRLVGSGPLAGQVSNWATVTFQFK